MIQATVTVIESKIRARRMTASGADLLPVLSIIIVHVADRCACSCKDNDDDDQRKHHFDDADDDSRRCKPFAVAVAFRDLVLPDDRAYQPRNGEEEGEDKSDDRKHVGLGRFRRFHRTDLHTAVGADDSLIVDLFSTIFTEHSLSPLVIKFLTYFHYIAFNFLCQVK